MSVHYLNPILIVYKLYTPNTETRPLALHQITYNHDRYYSSFYSEVLVAGWLHPNTPSLTATTRTQRTQRCVFTSEVLFRLDRAVAIVDYILIITNSRTMKVLPHHFYPSYHPK